MAFVITQAGNPTVPALLALQAAGFEVGVEDDTVTATSPEGRFVADDPIAVLGLIKLIELRGSDWAASDAEIEHTLARFKLA